MRAPFLFLVSVVAALFTPIVDDPAQRIRVSLSHVLDIGEAEADSTEYLFGRPTSVMPGPDGYIYVADRHTYNIRVFDPSGTYVRTLGSRGEGPAEFASVAMLAFDASGHLLAWDKGMRFRLTRLHPETGEEIDTYPMAGRFRTGVASFQPGPAIDGQPTYIFLLHRESPDDTRDDHRYFTVRGEDMSSVLATFGAYDLAYSPDRFAKIHALAWPGQFVVEDDGDVWFAPGIYTGTLHRFAYEGGHWEQAQGAEGYVEDGRPHVTIDPGSERRDDYLYVQNTERTDAGRSRNTSIGLVQLSTGELVHFTYYIRDDQGHVVAEVFGPEGALIGWDVVYEDLPVQAYPPLRAVSIDGNDRIYWIDETDVPRVRVTTFAYETTE